MEGVSVFADRYELDPLVPVTVRVALLDAIAREGAALPVIRGTAMQLLAAYGTTPRLVGEAVAWVRSLLTYTPEKGEQYFRVAAILARRVDDCDGYTCLTNAVLLAAGLDARAEYQVTGAFAHVFSLVAAPPGAPLQPLDATLGGALGEDPYAARVRLWGV